MNMSACDRQSSHEQLAKTVLCEKYNKEFAIKSIERQYIFDNYYSVVAFPIDNPQLLFNASINADGSGSSDNYYAKLFFARFSDEMEQKLDSLNGIYYIYSSGLIEDMGFLSEDIGINDYFNLYSNLIDIHLLYCSDNSDYLADYKVISHILDNINNVNGTFYIYVLDDENSLKKIINFIETNPQLSHEFKELTTIYKREAINIKDSRLEISESEFVNMMESNANGT